MKIAVFGYTGWYGSMAEWIADGFEANGHTVDRIDRKEIVLSPESYDFILFADCSEDYSDRIPKCPDCLKVFWSMDAHMPEGAERSTNIARKCDLVFSSNYEHGVKILEKFGIESFLMPITWNDTILDHSKYRDLRDVDVAMIGNPNSGKRRELWNLLHDNFKCISGRIETSKDYRSAMLNSKFVVNQPTEPWDNILNNRFFEAFGSKSLLFQKELKTDLIEKLGFKDGIHFLYWKDFDDLMDKIPKYFIDGRLTDQARAMINFSNKKVQRYSMSAQCAKMEAIILDKFYDRL